MATSERDGAPWIPIEDLPVDLQAKCAGSTDGRMHDDGRVYQLSGRARAAGFLALGLGLLVALVTTHTPAFGSIFRAALLVAGLAFLAAWVAFRRTRRFLGSDGQRLVIGPTCLVIVDAAAVRVLPAERLGISRYSVDFVGETIEKGAISGLWREELERAHTAASDPAACAADRFRAAAERGRPLTVSQVRWTRRAPALVAALAGVLVAFILETGPLHARAMGGAEAEAKARRYALAVSEKVSQRELFAGSVATDVAAVAKATARARLFAVAASGKEADLRVFLQQADADDPARLDVLDRLSVLCTAQFPVVPGFQGLARIQRLLERLACMSGTGKVFTFTFSYDNSVPEITLRGAQQVADELAAKLRTTSTVRANMESSAPVLEPYVEMKLTKDGVAWGGVQHVKAVLTIHDARGAASEPYTYSTKIPDPTYVAPVVNTPDPYNPGGGSFDPCPSAVTCGYGAGGWCCPYGTRCDPSGPPGQRCVL
jgi:hypothetical protein